MNCWRIVTLAAAIAVLGTSSLASQTSLTGDWVITITSPQGTTELKTKVTQEGEKVSGLLSTPLGEMPFEGTLTGPDLKITYVFAVAAQSLTVVMAGKVEGESLKGTIDFGGVAQADWTAKRAPVAGAIPTVPEPSPGRATSGPPVNVAGKWNLSIRMPQSGTVLSGIVTSATLYQDEEKVTGTLGTLPLTGTIQGNSLTFTSLVDIEGQRVPINISAEVEGNSLKGPADFGGLGQGNLTGQRAAE